MRNLEALKMACDDIVHDPALEPIRDASGRIVETHCNEGAERVAQAMGCRELDGLMADDQFEVMQFNSSGMWLRVDGESATVHALSGGLAFAAMSSEMLGEVHGHIAAIYPAAMQFSGSLNRDVPMVANIGKTDAEEKESAAFPVKKGEPNYYVWVG